jgi:hypothetical protein
VTEAVSSTTDADQHLLRRANLLAALQTFAQARLHAGEPAKGIEAAFAVQLQISPSMLSQIKSSRPISNKLAAQIEVLLRLPAGAISLAPDAGAASAAQARQRFTELAGKAWDKADAAQRKALKLALRQVFL